jgi:acetolactate synthase-1/2/3 large subunit
MKRVAETLTTAQVMARYLSQAGIRHVFGYPGDPNIEFMEQARREGIEFVLGRREGTAAFMAEAYGQLSGRPGVCLATLGPGCTNLINANATALLDRTPMISIAGQLSTTLEPVFTHQNIDQLRLFSSVTKWTAQMVPGAAASIMRKAFRVAMAERPGPVHLITHADTLKTPATDSDIRLPPMVALDGEPQVFSTNGGPDWIGLLARARRPVIVTGISAVRAKAGAAIRGLAEHVGCPVVVSPKAKGILAADHPYFAGTLDMACGPVVWKFLESCDLILAIGFDAVELIKSWRLKASVLHIDSSPNTDQVYPADTEVVGSIPAIVNTLTAAYKGELCWSEADVRRHMETLWGVYYSGRVAGKLNPTDVIDEVKKAFPRDTIVTTDVGSHKLLVGQGWPANQPQTVLMTNGLSSMGFGLPGAMTAKLLNPDRSVICFTGDGGLAMVQSELQLASSLKLGLVIVVFCDNSLNRIELKQMALKYPSFGTRIESTDLVKVAEAMGCDGAHVEQPEQLERVLANSSKLTRPLVIETYIDPAQYIAQF